VLLLDCLSKPIRQIALNAGYDGENIAQAVQNANHGPAANNRNGFDASTGLYPADMFAAGIVDPLRVVRSSLNAAASEACLLLLTEVVLGNIPEQAQQQMSGQVGPRR
jgi:chaperonin GroEL